MIGVVIGVVGVGVVIVVGDDVVVAGVVVADVVAGAVVVVVVVTVVVVVAVGVVVVVVVVVADAAVVVLLLLLVAAVVGVGHRKLQVMSATQYPLLLACLCDMKGPWQKRMNARLRCAFVEFGKWAKDNRERHNQMCFTAASVPYNTETCTT